MPARSRISTRPTRFEFVLRILILLIDQSLGNTAKNIALKRRQGPWHQSQI